MCASKIASMGSVRWVRSPVARRRWPLVLLVASVLMFADSPSAAAGTTIRLTTDAIQPIPLNTTNWSGSAGFGSTAPGWYQDSFGIVHLSGAAKQISTSPPGLAILIGTLPVAARPDRDVFTIVHTFSGTYADVEIETNGTIAVIGPARPAVEDLSFVSLEGIIYQPANGGILGAFVVDHNWSASTGFGSSVGAPAMYMAGSLTAGSTLYLEGAARQVSSSGTADLGTVSCVGSVNSVCVGRPGDTVYTIASTNLGTYADVAITPTGDIEMIAPRPPALTDLSFVSLEGISFASQTQPSTRLGVNTSNWSPDAGFDSGTPQWYEDTAGTIHLEGAAKQTSSNGPNANLVATLPAGACPPRSVFTIVHTFSGTYADLAIQPNGQILVIPPRPPAVTDLSFLSLESITFNAPTPKLFRLRVRRIETQGATVTATLSRPRTIALLVQKMRGHRLIEVGVVRLGQYPAGTSPIHWNLKVDRRLLAAGTYEVTLHALNGKLLSIPAPPGNLTLTVHRNGQVRVEK